MGKKITTVSRDVNGVSVEQRHIDGFINITAMAVAHNKKIDSWLRTQETLELFQALAESLNIKCVDLSISDAARLSASKYAKIFPGLIIVRQGSPENGGGTWVHPDLAVQAAQWCNKPFALSVSRWVREWMNSAYNPIQLEADADRVQMRDSLKDSKRLEFTGQIKAFLEAAGRYNPGSRSTNLEFAKAHDKLNRLLTTETAKGMRSRLEQKLSKTVSESELLRDYFPINALADYAAMCQAAANEMALNGTDPLTALDIAAKQVLSRSYTPRPIDFTERIGLVRQRLQQKDQLLLAGT